MVSDWKFHTAAAPGPLTFSEWILPALPHKQINCFAEERLHGRVFIDRHSI
jgi:hypothetical protein